MSAPRSEHGYRVRMAQPTSWFTVKRGWDVAGSGGARIGRVEATLGDQRNDIFDGLIVGALGGINRHYVPADKVVAIEEGRIVVDLADLDEAERYDAEAPGSMS
jgi:hypothetical protein